jgi:methylmalonyl-CoA mutase N-terminal domain/subunit
MPLLPTSRGDRIPENDNEIGGLRSKRRVISRRPSMSIFDPKTLEASRAAAEQWSAEYDKLLRRFGDAVPEQARAPRTESGLPIRSCYFPHDLEQALSGDGNGAAAAVATQAPGAYPFTRGNLPSAYQLMAWANQPVIGFGLPEQTRERMDLLTKQGMVGYFGQPFYNLVYDLVSHEGIDPDHPAARGRIGQCGMAVYSTRDMERLFHGMDPTKMNVVHITYYQVVPALAQYIAYAKRLGVDKADLRGNSMNWYHQSAYVGMSASRPRTASSSRWRSSRTRASTCRGGTRPTSSPMASKKRAARRCRRWG